MTDTNNGWLGKPGVPLNPEKDGWHWVSLLGGRHPQIIEWFSDEMEWDGGWTTEDFGQHFRYLGPCLTPDQATALQARVAELERLAENANQCLKAALNDKDWPWDTDQHRDTTLCFYELRAALEGKKDE